jgi:hypothetical protein
MWYYFKKKDREARYASIGWIGWGFGLGSSNTPNEMIF